MKRTLYKTLIFCSIFLGVFAGCSKSSAPKSESTTPAPDSRTGWKLKLVSQPAASTGSIDQWKAGYGFTVTDEGKYEVGPGPQGEILAGELEDEEFKPIQDLVGKTFNAALTESVANTHCVDQSGGNAADRLLLVERGEEREVLHTDAAHLCISTQGSPDDLSAIHKAMGDLASKYYPLPFPSDCVRAVIGVEALYDPLRSCNTNSDCVYVDHASYTTVATGEEQAIVTDACTLLRPLVTANAEKVAESQEALLDAREKARATCGESMDRPACSGARGFYSSEAAPACVAGTCQKAGGVSIHPL